MVMRFNPLEAVSQEVVTLEADPATRNVGSGGAWTTLETYTFTVDDIKNNRWQVMEFLISYDLFNTAAVRGQTRVLATNKTTNAYNMSNVDTARYEYTIPVFDWSKAVVINIQETATGADTLTLKAIKIQARVVTFV